MGQGLGSERRASVAMKKGSRLCGKATRTLIVELAVGRIPFSEPLQSHLKPLCHIRAGGPGSGDPADADATPMRSVPTVAALACGAAASLLCRTAARFSGGR